MSVTTISITQELRRRLKVLASYRDITYDQLLEDLLYAYEAEQPFKTEKEFSDWFEYQFEVFGFKQVKRKNRFRSPDFVMVDHDGKEVNVELELLDKNFKLHGHHLQDINFDYVVCAYATKENICGVPILSLKHRPPWKAKLILDVPDDIWNRFKAITPKSKTMKQAVIDLIEEFVSEKEGGKKDK